MPARQLPQPTGYARAKLEVEGSGETIECWFNPKEYSIAKANTWKVEPVVGAALPTAQFTGGQARKLTLDLLFDSTDSSLDVRDITNKLFRLMEVDQSLGSGQNVNSGRPPMITFSWGGTVSFQAVADNLSVQYMLFRPDGTPVRAQAKLSLIQVESARDSSSRRGRTPGGNPTTRAVPGLGSHLVRDGDSLQSIAYKAYGDPTKWRAIAEENGIDDPLRLRRGEALSIPRILE